MKYPLLKRYAKKSRLLRVLARHYISKTRYFNWDGLLNETGSNWDEILHQVKGSGKILIPTSVGGQIGSTNMESLLGVALTLRGAHCEFILCDAELPACMGCEFWHIGNLDRANSNPLSRTFCGSCYAPANKTYSRLGLPIHRFSDWTTQEEREWCQTVSLTVPYGDIASFTHEDLPVGEHAFAGALRFYAQGDLENVPIAESVLRQYLAASLITVCVFNRLLDENSYDCAVFNHGIYVPQGIIGALCRRKGIRVVNWNPAYRKRCFIFSHHDTYHHTMMSEPVDNWMSIPWDEHREKILAVYLKSRWNGANDWIWFHEKPLHRVGAALARLGVDPARPCIGMLTSVMWDAVLHYPSNAFANMLEWVHETIDYFKSRPELQLIIRIHPAEIQGGLPSRQRVLDEIHKRFPGAIPENVFIIPPESKLSTYALMEKCNAVTIYNTKTGIELAATGIPVIVAGEAWIRNKGFSTDVFSPAEYFRALDRLPLTSRMSEADILKAKKYAHHFFFRRMVPLEFMEPTGGNPPFRINLKNINELRPGISRGLDLVCDGILHGTDFIFDEPTSGKQPALA
jgi:hypothetical protein